MRPVMRAVASVCLCVRLVWRPRHQTEIVNGAHRYPGSVWPIPAPCPSIDASQKETEYSYNAF